MSSLEKVLDKGSGQATQPFSIHRKVKDLLERSLIFLKLLIINNNFSKVFLQKMIRRIKWVFLLKNSLDMYLNTEMLTKIKPLVQQMLRFRMFKQSFGKISAKMTNHYLKVAMEDQDHKLHFKQSPFSALSQCPNLKMVHSFDLKMK